MSRKNDSLPENQRKRKMTATDDYAPINDDKISDDQYAPPPEDDAHYYDDNTYGVEVEPSSLASNVPYAEPTDFPTKKPRTGEPTSASNINTVMPTNQQTANNTESDDDIPIYEKEPSLAPIQSPMPTIIENDDEMDDDEVEVRTPVPTHVPTFVPVQPPQQQTSNRQVGWTTGEIVGTSVGGFVGLLMLIPFVRFFVKKFTNPSVGVAHPVRSNAYSSNEVVGNDDIEGSTGGAPELNGEELQQQVEMIKKQKKVDLTRNSKKVIPIDLKGIEEKPVESTLASLLQSQPKKSSKITLEPIKIGPSSSSILNLDATPVVNNSKVLGGGKED